MSKIAAESILQIKKKCQLNLVAFRHILLNNADEVEPAEFHYEWSDSLLHGVDNEAIEAFRESAKTNYVTRAFPLYALTFPDRKRDYIVIVKKNATLASNKLKEIEEEYLSNEVAKSNLVKIHQQSGDCFSVDVKDENGEVINVRIEAYGKGASIRGLANKDRRPKICHVKGSLIWQDGRLVKVEDSKWPKGEVESDTLEIRVHGIPYKEKVSCDHRFWCRTKKKINNKWRFINIGEWKYADDLSVNDYIGTPIDYASLPMIKIYKNIPTITKRNSKGQVVGRGVGQRETIPEYFNDNEFWWAVGLWWGDGHISKNKVYWSCANKYPKIKNRLQALISRYSNGRYKQSGQGCEVLVWNRTDLSDWLKTWRHGNSIKIPPMWVRSLDNEKIKNIVQGYLDSDGWMDRDRKQARITSVNYEGLLILSGMIARLGIASFVRMGAGPRVERFPNGNTSLSRQKYDLMMSNGTELFGMEGERIKPKRIDTVFISDGFIWRKVREINEAGINTIIPITTETHTYLSPLGLSHNCIVDDPQDTDDASSQVALESDWNWFLSNVIFLGQTTRVFLIGNNLGEKCIIERVISMDGQLESIKFNSKRIAALTEDGKSAWEAKRSVAEIELEKEDFRRLGKLDIWLREKMCQAVGEELRAFDPQDYRYFPFPDTEKILAQCNRFGVLDPASSPEMTSCYRAIVVVGCNSDNHWFVADVPFGRWDSAQMIDEIFGAVQKYEIQDFGIEKGIFKQVLEPFIYKEMARRNVFFNIVPIEHAKRGSKLERIKMLQPRFKAHQIWFPNEAKWLAELQLELAGVTKDAIKSLYSDLMDALAMIPQIVKVPGKKNISGIANARNPQPVAEARLI